MSELLTAALDYASRWPVLPLSEREKLPLTDSALGLWNGHKQATTDKKRLREIWAKHPNVNVGIRVGVNSKLLIIDVDNKGNKHGSAELEKLEEKLGQLPRTYTGTDAYGRVSLLFYVSSRADRQAT